MTSRHRPAILACWESTDMPRVMVVEDQKKLLRSLQQGLQEEGYDVVAATNGEEGYYRATSTAGRTII